VHLLLGNINTQIIVRVLEAEETTEGLHDKVLVELTRQVNKLVDAAAARAPEGKTLAALLTPHGLFYAWDIEVDDELTDEIKATGVHAESEPDEIRRALKYKLPG
jgi:hypothetical protein